MGREQELALENFPLVAREFCQFIEQSSLNQRRPFVQQLFARLARLCDVANRLPWVKPTTADVEINQDEIKSQSDECFKLAERLRRTFGDVDSYWDVFDPTEKEEPVNGSLANDIAEIYMDLKDALNLLEEGTDLGDVHWQWRFDFREHWGRHAGSALRVLLCISDLS